MNMPDTQIPEDLTYTEEHLWLSLDSDVGTVGLKMVSERQHR